MTHEDVEELSRQDKIHLRNMFAKRGSQIPCPDSPYAYSIELDGLIVTVCEETYHIDIHIDM